MFFTYAYTYHVEDRGLIYIVCKKHALSPDTKTVEAQIGLAYFWFTGRMNVREIKCGRLWEFTAVKVLMFGVLGYVACSLVCRH
jgi:hypothetical protein